MNTAAKIRRMRRRCAYCGRRLRHPGIACYAHADLPKLDPHYGQAT